jgi:hypothetical protein
MKFKFFRKIKKKQEIKYVLREKRDREGGRERGM